MNSYLVSWRNLTRYKKRFFFTLAAIVLAVMVTTGMLIAKQTTEKISDDYQKMYAGSADYWVKSNGYSFHESDLNWLKESDSFEKGNASLIKQGFIELQGTDASPAQTSVRLTGVSSFDNGLFDLPEKEGDITKEGLIITENAAKLWDKGIGDTITFKDMGEMKVTAIVYEGSMLRSPKNMEEAYFQHSRVMVPLKVLQSWTGLENEITDFRFKVKEDSKGEALLSDYQSTLSASDLFVQPVVIDDRANNDTEGLYWTFDLVSVLSIFISAFIVFNMIYASIMERNKEFAVMKSLGYTNVCIYKLVLREIALLSMLGTVIGLPLGIWFGAYFQSMLTSAISTQNITYELELALPLMIAAVAGILFPFLAASYPIYQAGKTPVIMGVHDHLGQKEMYKKRNIIRIMLGLLFTVAGLIDFDWNLLFLFVGLVLLYPFFLRGIQRLITPLVNGVFRYPGKQAINTVQQFENRNANTSAMLAIGVCLALFMSAALEAIPNKTASDIRAEYGGDIHVLKETPWMDDDLDTIKQMDGVKDVHRFADIPNVTWKTKEGAQREFSVMSDIDNLENTKLFRITKQLENKSELPTIYLGDRALSEWGGNVGDKLSMNTPAGSDDFFVGASVQTTHYNGYVAFVADEELNHTFQWPNPYYLAISTQNEAYTSSIQHQLWEGNGEEISRITTVPQTIERTNQAFEGMTELMQGLLLLVIALSAIGVSNTLFMNTIERTKEIGMMRAIGFTKQQVKLMIIAEGMIVGVTGVIVGIVYGILAIYLNAHAEQAQSILTFTVPWFSLFLAISGGMLFTIIASWLPSITASRIPVKEAISYE